MKARQKGASDAELHDIVRRRHGEVVRATARARYLPRAFGGDEAQSAAIETLFKVSSPRPPMVMRQGAVRPTRARRHEKGDRHLKRRRIEFEAKWASDSSADDAATRFRSVSTSPKSPRRRKVAARPLRRTAGATTRAITTGICAAQAVPAHRYSDHNSRFGAVGASSTTHGRAHALLYAT